MEKHKIKSKISAFAFILMLTITATLIASPVVNAQALEMNLPGDEGAVHYVLIHDPDYDIDLNGGPGGDQPVELWVKYPGRADFTYIDTYTTASGGDLDVYDFDFNQTGDFELKWMFEGESSNVETARCISDRNQLPVQHYPAFVYIAGAPDPVGIGQTVTIVIWTAEMPPQTSADQLLGSVGNRAAWTGMTVTVAKPDGTKQTIALRATDPVGSTWYSYVPDQVGTYSIQSHFPATWKNATMANILYAAADSDVAKFVVQEEQLEDIPGVPLPAEYWTRPIHAYNRRWSQIAGNWITGNRDNPYITAPDTAHVMWTEPYFFGGIAGGAHESYSYYEGTSYESKFGGVTIMQGILFYEVNLGSSSSGGYQKVVARDLRTGELLWAVNETSISSSMIYEYWSPNQHGVHPYLWASGNTLLDPFSGTELFSFKNVPSGTAAVGPQGERLIYRFGGPSSDRTWLALWDFSYSPSMTGLSSSQWAGFLADPSGFVKSTSYWQWRPIGKEHDGTMGYRWNVTLPPGLGTSYQIYALEDRIISGTGFAQFGTSAYHETYTMWAVSTKEGQQGQLLWKIAPKPPAANVTLQWSSASVEDGVVVLRAKETRQLVGFDINTGEQLWITDSEPQWMMYSSGSTIRYGKVYRTGYGGEIYAYDATNGTLLWTAAGDNEGLESAYERSPLSISVVDGKIYARSSEHSFTQPFYRTWKTYCFDAETGERIWDLTGTGTGYGFADGYMVYLQYSDLQIYCIGKGPSATTVTASPKVSVHGNSVLVEGSVTDISAGTKSSALTTRFPNGVPAIADESMSRWMEYVYMQMPMPMNATGVPVTLDAIDPNGNFISIGTTTSDLSGFYSLMWEPEIEGKYTVIATFEGSDSYWASYAETAIGVGPELTPGTPIEPEPTEPEPLITTEIAIIAAIVIAAIIGIVAFWALRRRK